VPSADKLSRASPFAAGTYIVPEKLRKQFATPQLKPEDPAVEARNAAALKEISEVAFYPVEESPMMKMLVKVKKDLLSRTGKLHPVDRGIPGTNPIDPLTVLTTVTGTGAKVSSVVQKPIREYALAMGRSFRVGWGPNGELIHAGRPIFSSVDAEFGKKHRIVIEKVDTTRWTRSKAGPGAARDVEASFVGPLQAMLNNSFVFESPAAAAPSNDEEGGGSVPTYAPLWRAPYAKSWELKEYLPYLQMLKEANESFSARSLPSSHPDWVTSKALALVTAISGQEEVSYKAALTAVNAAGGLKSEQIDFDQLQSAVDLMPLYEERAGYPAADWERRREAISQWLRDVTTVEGKHCMV
jgi:hypothetical protein